jgi:WD40 repeat protein
VEHTASYKKDLPMSRGKQWNLVMIGFLVALGSTVLFTYLRATAPQTLTDQPTVLQGHRFPIQALTFSHDGTTLTSVAFYITKEAVKCEVADWDVTTGQPTVRAVAPIQACRCLALAPDGRMLSAPRQDSNVWLWKRNPMQELRLGEYRAPVYALAFSVDGSLLAIADGGTDILLREVASGRQTAACRGHVEQVCALAFAPDGKLLASGGTDTTVRLWDAATGESRADLRQHTRPVQALAFSPDGRTLASADWDGVVGLWDVATQTTRAVLTTSREPVTPGRFFEEAAALSFAPDGRTLAVAMGRVVQLWDTVTATRVANLVGHEGKVKCLAYSPDGTRLASGSHDRTVRLWDVRRHGTMSP